MSSTKGIAAALAMAIGAASFTGPAEAGHRHHHHYHHGNGGAVAAGILGLGVGAVIGGALAQPRYYPGTVYVEPAPVYVRPAPVVVYQAWTPAWYESCGARYRSFNPDTGYYLGHDGRYHFCR